MEQVTLDIIAPVISLLIFAILTPLMDYTGRELKWKDLPGVWSTISFLVSMYFLYEIYRVQSLRGPLQWSVFYVDMFSVYIAFVFIFLGLLATFYSIEYMGHDTGQGFYYALTQTMIAGMVGVAFVRDLFSLFVFWELMALSSYVLVAFRKEKWEPVEAATKYYVMSSSGSITYLLSLSLLYGLTGTLNIQQLASILTTSSPVLYAIMGMMIVAFGIKAAVVPFHTWLLDAHPAAPSPISALLSGVVIKTGIYALARIFFTIFIPSTFNYGLLLAILAGLTMTIGNLMALLQTDIKRLLAASSVTQIGFILIGLSSAAFNPIFALSGLTSALFHLFNHAVMKGLAFLAAGSIIHRLGTRNINDLIGIGRNMPVTAVCLSIALLALGGVPSLNGFMSKWMLFSSAINAGLPVLALVGILNSGFSVGYYLWIIHRLILLKPVSNREINEKSLSIMLPLIVLAALCILIGVYPQIIVQFAEKAASVLLT